VEQTVNTQSRDQNSFQITNEIQKKKEMFFVEQNICLLNKKSINMMRIFDMKEKKFKTQFHLKNWVCARKR